MNKIWGVGEREQRLSAMEVAGDELQDLLGRVLDVATQGGVVESSQLGDDAIDHGGGEDTMLLEDCTLAVEAGSGGDTRVGKLGQGGQAVGILGGMDVDIDVGVAGYVKGVGHLETVTAGDTQAGKELVEVGGAVGGTHLDSLLLAGERRGLRGEGNVLGIGERGHIDIGCPAEGDAHEDGTVAVAPADIGGGFLMGHETEVAGGVLVAEGGDGGCEVHHAGNHAAGALGELAVGEHLVAAVLHHAHVDVEPGAGLAGGDLGGEGDVVAQLVAEVADDPLGYHELVGGLLDGHGEELDLVLLVVLALEAEVADLGMAVLDLAACLGDVLHALLAELVGLGIGCGLVVAALVLGGEHLLVVGDDVVLELAHGLELHAGDLAEGLGGLVQGMLRGGLEGMAVLVEIGTQHGDGGYLGEGVDECRLVAGQHVEVAGACLYEGEQAAAVDALAAAEDGVEVGQVVDDEVEGLQLAVAAGVHEVDHADVVLDDVVDDVGLGELGRWFLEKQHHGIGAVNEFLVVHFVLSCLKVCDIDGTKIQNNIQ